MKEENKDNIGISNENYEEPEWMNIVKKIVKEPIKNNPKKNESKRQKGIKFWKKWLNADLLKREKMVGKLPIMKSFWEMENMSRKFTKQILTIMINCFFGDLEAQIYLEVNGD
ncbi:MAG: hypothetical protein Q8L27_03185 [archaeon]|nr:hypothetical protein [archaeon]